CAPLKALMRLTTMFGSSVTTTAERTSVASATIGVEMIGNPNPVSPCATPAKSTMAQTHAIPQPEARSSTARVASVGRRPVERVTLGRGRGLLAPVGLDHAAAHR